MAYAPYTNLQATPDFAMFQFASPTLPEPTIRQVRFISHQGGRIYHVELRSQPAHKKDDAHWTDSKEFFCAVLTVLQIIEIYSERYPRRILRFCGDTAIKVLFFGTIFERFHHLLAPFFQIEPEMPVRGEGNGKERPCPFAGGPEGKDRFHAFLVTRKPFPYLSIHTVESTWNGNSRIFNNRFSIELDKSIRIGLTLPTV